MSLWCICIYKQVIVQYLAKEVVRNKNIKKQLEMSRDIKRQYRLINDVIKPTLVILLSYFILKVIGNYISSGIYL